MSVLETFYILFKTDAKDATDDVKGLGAATQSLAIPLALATAAFAALGAGVAAALARVDAVDNIGDVASKLRVSASDLDAFTRAARATGASIEDATGNLATFGDKLNDAAARPDGINGKNFAKWGIAFRNTKGEAVGAIDGILALAKSLEGLGQAEQLGRLRKLGIEDADTIAFLLQGKQAILDKMDAEKRAGVVTERQIEIAGDYQAALGAAQNAIDTWSNDLVELFIPAVSAALRAFTSLANWFRDHKAVIEGFFIGVATVVTTIYGPAMASAAAATIAATWPILAIGAAILAVGAAFALAYEDVRAFMAGQPSVIGELVKKYEWAAETVRFIGRAFKALQTGAVAAWGGIKIAASLYVEYITGVWEGVKAAVKSLEPILNALKDTFAALRELVTAIGDRFKQDFGPAVEAVGEIVSAVFKDIFGDFSSMKAAVGEVGEAITGGFTAAFNAVMAAWDRTIGLIADKIRAIADGVRNLAASISGASVGGPAPLPATGPQSPGGAIGGLFNPNAGQTPAGLDEGKKLLRGAATTPMSGQTPATLTPANTNIKRESNVNINKVEVHTQAVDAKGMAAAAKSALQGALRGASSHFDDGVDR